MIGVAGAVAYVLSMVVHPLTPPLHQVMDKITPFTRHDSSLFFALEKQNK